MKKLIVRVALLIILGLSIFVFTGCTLKLETTDNSVSASVDGETSETIDNVFDWIKERIDRLFNTDEERKEQEEIKIETTDKGVA